MSGRNECTSYKISERNTTFRSTKKTHRQKNTLRKCNLKINTQFLDGLANVWDWGRFFITSLHVHNSCSWLNATRTIYLIELLV